MNNNNTKSIQESIIHYINKHAEQFENIIVDVDTIIDEAVQDYDTAILLIKKEIINSPEVIEDPQEEMRSRIKKLNDQIITTTLDKIKILTNNSAH